MCDISNSFEIKPRSEIVDYGSYRPGILFGSFTDDNVTLIRAYCKKCDYSVLLLNSDSRTIRIENKMTGKWGWIKKLWACIDEEQQLYAAQYVYGFFQGKKWRCKYCINDNFFHLKNRIIASRNGDRLDNTVWPYIIYIPELEPPSVRDRIALIRGSQKKFFS
jgi:hypothetical protein